MTLEDIVAITPTRDQIEQLLADSRTRTGEVVMLNLLKFKERSDAGDSGADSYGRYGAAVTAMVEAQGGHLVWAGTPDQVLIGDEDANDWDAVALVSYPSRTAFMEMTRREDYQEAHTHREGGLERTVLIAMTPGAALTGGGGKS